MNSGCSTPELAAIATQRCRAVFHLFKTKKAPRSLGRAASSRRAGAWKALPAGKLVGLRPCEGPPLPRVGRSPVPVVVRFVSRHRFWQPNRLARLEKTCSTASCATSQRILKNRNFKKGQDRGRANLCLLRHFVPYAVSPRNKLHSWLPCGKIRCVKNQKKQAGVILGEGFEKMSSLFLIHIHDARDWTR